MTTLVCLLCLAVEPKVMVDVTVNENVVLDGRKSLSDYPLRWQVISPSKLILQTLRDGRKWFPNKNQGQCIIGVTAYGVSKGNVKVDAQVISVIVMKEAALPAQIRVELIYPGTMTMDLANQMLRPEVRTIAKEKHIPLLYLYDNNADVDRLRLRPYIVGKKLPVALIREQATGKVLEVKEAVDPETLSEYLKGK
jgi:hypothetical protein